MESLKKDNLHFDSDVYLVILITGMFLALFAAFLGYI